MQIVADHSCPAAGGAADDDDAVAGGRSSDSRRTVADYHADVDRLDIGDSFADYSNHDLHQDDY